MSCSTTSRQENAISKRLLAKANGSATTAAATASRSQGAPGVMGRHEVLRTTSTIQQNRMKERHALECEMRGDAVQQIKVTAD
eukprot:2600300-Pleurochrysis_carterae.AAC.1